MQRPITRIKLAAFLLSASLQTCAPNREYLQEQGMPKYNLVIDVNSTETATIIVQPCRRAGVWMDEDGYTIRCNDELLFTHSDHANHLRFAGISYWDNDLDGIVDRIDINEIQVDIYSTNLNQFYSSKLRELRVGYVEKEWQKYLRERR